VSTDYVFINASDTLPALETSLHFTISSYFTEFIQNICFYVFYQLVKIVSIVIIYDIFISQRTPIFRQQN
jgi:hypothetical protein